ncbi:MAG: peptide chain release factor-like protein [Veillonella parvula]
MQNREQALRLLRAKLFELELEKQAELKEQIGGTYQAIEWGSQIRSYVFHPYNLVKDHRTSVETGNVQAVMDGNLDPFIEGFLKKEANLSNLGDTMKKFLLFLLVLIIALVVASQFLLPSFIGSRIESQLNETLKPTAQTVNVEAQPAFKILYGEVDRVYGTLENIKLRKLNFASFRFDAKQIFVNPISLLASQQIDIVSVGNASIDWDY